MVAWGLCGVLGAVLGRAHRAPARARAAGARLRRAPGLVFGVIMDISVWVTYGAGSRRSPSSCAISGDVAAVQPRPRGRQRRLLPRLRAGARARAAALPRAARGALGRPGRRRAAGARRAARAAARARRRRLGALAGRAAAPTRPAAQTRAAGWLTRAQNADGGWGAAPGARSNAVQTAWTVIGLAASGRNPLRVRTRGAHAAARCCARRPPARAPTADLQRTALGARRRGPVAADRRRVRSPARARSARDGSFSRLVNQTVLRDPRAARRGRQRARPPRAPRRDLARAPARTATAASASPAAARAAPTTRPARCMALAIARGRGARSVRARRAPGSRATRTATAATRSSRRARSNAQSAALAVQGLLAAGRDPARQRRRGARSPLAFLRSLAAAERPRPLQPHERADAGLGHRPGARGARPATAAGAWTLTRRAPERAIG